VEEKRSTAVVAIRRRTRVLAVCAIAAGVLPLLPGTGHAQSIASVRAEIAAVTRQVNELNARTETITNAYDLGRIQLAAAENAVAVADGRLSAARRTVRRMGSQLSGLVTAAYQSGALGTLAALTEGGPETFLERTTSLQALSAGDQVSLNAYRAAGDARQQASAAARQALGNQAAITRRLAGERRAILAAAAKEQNLLASLESKERQLERQARARAARAAAARAAQIAAERRAAAAAAKAFGSTPTTPAPPPPTSGTPASGAAAKIAVQWAYAEIGKPYVWGAAGPDSFDCSGLTQYVWAKAGVYLQHYTGDQWNEGTHVSVSQLEPGDLVFFVGSDGTWAVPGHVGIYIGNGEMIDAPYTGVDVRIDSISQPDYVGAVRPY
jgi:cell wall-associated NlpC family hydrolase